MVHLYFNVIGTITFMVIFYTLNAFVHFDFLAEPAIRSAAASGFAEITDMIDNMADLGYEYFFPCQIPQAQHAYQPFSVHDRKSAYTAG